MAPMNASCRLFAESDFRKFTEKERSDLQRGEACANLSDERLREFFASDTSLSTAKKNVEVLGIPKGQVAFIFCKIKGKQDGIQTFIDRAKRGSLSVETQVVQDEQCARICL